MVLEQFLEVETIHKKYLYVFLLGIGYVFISYLVAKLFFSSALSIAMLFLITILIIPTLIYMLNYEEKIESKFGIKHFFTNHKTIMNVYVSLFLGIFIGFLLFGFAVPDYETVFSYQINYLEKAEGLSPELIQNFKAESYNPDAGNFLSLISINLSVVVICFILSVFYGAGAIFLVILNASIFSSFITFVFKYLGGDLFKILTVFGTFMLHMLPEVTGFMVAAIAGGIVSRALYVEKVGTPGFRNVMNDCAILLIISFGLIVLGAFLEVYVTASLAHLVL